MYDDWDDDYQESSWDVLVDIASVLVFLGLGALVLYQMWGPPQGCSLIGLC